MQNEKKKKKKANEKTKSFVQEAHKLNLDRGDGLG